jgi:putative transposase
MKYAPVYVLFLMFVFFTSCGGQNKTDLPSQFTSEVFTSTLLNEKIQISMDGKGRAIDNIFIERLWRTVKYEHVYLHVAKDGVELYEGLKKYFSFYNQERLHQSLEYKAPAALYWKMKAA